MLGSGKLKNTFQLHTFFFQTHFMIYCKSLIAEWHFLQIHTLYVVHVHTVASLSTNTALSDAVFRGDSELNVENTKIFKTNQHRKKSSCLTSEAFCFSYELLLLL